MRSATTSRTLPTEQVPFVVLLVGAVCLGTLGGVVVANAPLVSGFGVGVLLAGGAALALGRRLRTAFLVTLSVTLGGYALIGKTFSYLGYPPVFIGEIVMVTGLFTALFYGNWRRFFAAPLGCVISLFAVWGAFVTLPFLSEYGVDAMRDAVIWGYAVFAAIVATSLTPPDVEATVRAYGRLLKWIPPAVLCFFVLNLVADESMPVLPWANVSLVHFKPGDAGVHLGGAAAFLLLGLGWAGTTGPSRLIFWSAWLTAFAVAASLNRGGLLSVLAAGACAVASASRSAGRRLLVPAVVGVVLAAFTFVTPLAAGTDNHAGRFVSFQQVATNLVSIFSNTSSETLEGTKSWRLEWWGDIASYTFTGPHFWKGKGFGVNLADDDGFQVTSDGSLRSPHNIHMTMLARAGVPGLLLWVGVLVTFVLSMTGGIVRASRAGQVWWARVCAWVLAYWLAVLVDGTFDVYLEGPAGGIWFWCLTGFGILVLDAARRERRYRAAHQRVRASAQ